ncbi:Putative ATPase [Malassezia psittaci]|uniref:ATPase n=1 Tax=Malassezia psittaci TaxID=1821823 RepID=A0AAF0JIG4_9BASI|nr:Putative ATPase [Malassezia psittaci]
MDDPENEERMRKLDFLLQRSGIYSRIMGDKLKGFNPKSEQQQSKSSDEHESKRARTDAELGTLAAIARREQPKLVTGAQLKPYQMDGLIWLSSLFENGLNGILADEMGLGFDLGAADEQEGSKQSATSSFSTWSTETANRVVSQLHEILKPFLLRRIKTEVERDLPPKKEYLLYSPLSQLQAAMYNRVLDGTFREWLVAYKANVSENQLQKIRSLSSNDVDDRVASRGRKTKFSSTSKDFERLHEAGKYLADTEREVRNMRLDNTIMQLRKICCHPYLMHWPTVGDTTELTVDNAMVRASGKLRMLDQIMDALVAQQHRVLIFSQFTTMLDLLELWAKDIKNWDPYRIDGSTTQTERAEQVEEFNEKPFRSSRAIFLLSTRASGLGINLIGADTVIFFDSDWNPQMDLQAQDRVHRIGQKKPVLVFRMVAAGTIEQEILQKAKAKRVLEAVVIQKGKFRNPIKHKDIIEDTDQSKTQEDILAPTQVDVQAEDEDTPLMTSTELDLLLDRSTEAYARGRGWQSKPNDGTSPNKQQPSTSALFEVTETGQHAADPTLARIFSGEVKSS